MRKLLSLALAALLLLSLAACGRKEVPAASGTAGGVAETVLLDEGGVVVTATGFDPEGEDGPALLLHLKNGMDRDVQILAQDSAINGYMIDAMPYWTDASGHSYYGESPRVAAGGGELDSKLIFNTYDMRRSGVTTVAEMELSFRVDDADTWETLLEGAPAVLRTAAAETYEQTYDESGTLVYENDGVRIIVQGLETGDADWDEPPGVAVCVANWGERDIYVTAAKVVVNDTDMLDDTFFGAEVPVGKREVARLTFGALGSAAMLDELTVSFQIADRETGDSLAETEPVTLRWME